MTERWVIGVVSAFAVLVLSGVGFAAFTATATVNGSASPASTGLVVQVGNASSGAYCVFYLGGARDTMDAQISVTPANSWGTSIGVSVSNMVPGDICELPLYLENTGSVPLNVSVLITNQNSAMCPVWPHPDCYVTGLSTPYLTSVSVPPTETVVPSLPSGGIFSTYLFLEFAPFSTSPPATPGTFEFVFTGTAGD